MIKKTSLGQYCIMDELRRLGGVKGFKIYFMLLVAVLIIINTISNEPKKAKIPALIRLHIIANSDSDKDQRLKYKVKDSLVKLIRDDFKDCKSLAESRTRLLGKIPFLEKKAKEILACEGYNYDVKAVYGRFCFPTKYYGSFSLPAGEYESLRIIIGEGKGANWWCVLFPPLCFVDGEKSLCIQGDINKELEICQAEGQTVKIEPALKIVELLESIVK